MTDREWLPGQETSFRLGLGTGRLRDSQECIETVTRALGLGYRHFDTARAYQNEADIRTAIERSDVSVNDVFLATKLHSEHLTRDDVIEGVEESRQVLGVDTVDVVYVHWPAHTYEPEETLSALETLRSEGVIRHIGLSNFTTELVDEARKATAAPIGAVQVEMHPFLQQDRLCAYTQEHGIALVAHTPLCRGRVLDHPVLTGIAEKHGVTAAQVSLAWLLGKEHFAAIPTARGQHLEENLDALSITLNEGDVRQIEHIEETRRCADYDFAPWNRSD